MIFVAQQAGVDADARADRAGGAAPMAEREAETPGA